MAGNQITPIQAFDLELTKLRPQFEMVLPDHLPVDRLARTVRNCVQRDPKLLECGRASLWNSVMSAALFGLEVDGRQSAIIRFKNSAQWIPMVNGLVTIASNAGYVVQGELIREKDKFDFERGATPKLYHKPAFGVPHEDNPVIGAYAVAFNRKVQQPIFEIMDLPAINRVRNMSKGYQYAIQYNKSTLWVTDFPAMARKTPIRALCNHLPWQVQRAAEIEDHFDAGKTAWAKRREDGAIDVDFAWVDDSGSTVENMPDEHAARRVNEAGDTVTEEDYRRQMEAEGAAVQSKKAEGKL